ncbi:MAG: c-type cytochrome [Chitinophagaceae bacterium]|nr:MAG: c-type cytochrome [Chitinophagaceae bacterium]
MKKYLPFLVIPALLLVLTSCSGRKGAPRVLVFSKTSGWHHSSIPNGQAAIQKLGAENGFVVDTTSDAAYFSEDSLKNYAAVVFLQTTGDVLNNYQEADFERYIQSGGGYVGIHAAADTEFDWGWYGRLVGGYFNGHPAGTPTAMLRVVDPADNSTKHLPRDWKRVDEWYNYKKLNPDMHVLIELDETSYEGGTNGKKHPIAWYHDYDGGRAWYTGLGHTEASYTEEPFLQHLLAGIRYAMGDNKKNDYSKAHTARVPDEDRFNKTTLAQGVFAEPTEMAILPNLDVLVAQRRGELMMYDKETGKVKQVGLLNVYWKAVTQGVNTETGFLGIQADPDFARNHYIYAYYSPVDSSVDRLSRFRFENDTLSLFSEQVLLEVKTDREICCHTGGSIAFGPDRMLYVSTGDNSTPFDEPNQKYNTFSFAPLDDRPGFRQYDARRSPGNTNDLRGKILRIKINENGTVEIPDGNLFPKGMDKTRPEIYVMGNRNPYRITVDQKNSFLYWGEVGPDANADSTGTRGPRGYDEINQAQKAGNFGWPFFVGNNYPYHAYDYSNGVSGAAFDPARPVNESRNNTGLRELPPAQPAFIWYPYGESADFPQVGAGGRTAMAGPVFYSDLYPKGGLPSYYDGKVFIYEWIRGWIKVVTLDKDGKFDKMEPFMPNTKWYSPMDMELGPDGNIYVLEYGTGWFTQNNDAALVRIDFNSGNRPPKVSSITVDKNTGALPLRVSVTASVTDPEKDELTYTWHIGDKTRQSDDPELIYTINETGDFSIYAEVSDGKGNTVRTDAVQVYAGNEAPVVGIKVNGNNSFYFPGMKLDYTVKVEDKDGETTDLSDLYVSASYVDGMDKTTTMGHQQVSESTIGKNLVQNLDCKGCHKTDDVSVGPSFTQVAMKYKTDPNVSQYLAGKIINGSKGVWGETAMPAHSALKVEDVSAIVSFITSLTQTDKKPSLPAAGMIDATLGQPARDNGQLYLTATYSDKGGENIKPLTGTSTLLLRNNKVNIGRFTRPNGFTVADREGKSYAEVPAGGGSIALEDIDLSGISRVSLTAEWLKQPLPAFEFELRLDAPDGKKIGGFQFNEITFAADFGKAWHNAELLSALVPVTDGKKHTIYLISKAVTAGAGNRISLTSLKFIP